MHAVSIVWMAVNSVIVLFLSFLKDGTIATVVCSCTQLVAMIVTVVTTAVWKAAVCCHTLSVATAVHKSVAMIVTVVTTAVSVVPAAAADMLYVPIITPVLAHFLTQ
jgi:hypothetical protein